MRIAMMLTPLSDHHLALASQVGATDIVAPCPTPGKPGADASLNALRDLQQRIAAHGMRLSVIERGLPLNRIIHSQPDRDQLIAQVQQLLRDMGTLGIDVLCYNWMPEGDWTRTSLDLTDRGGALVTGFDAEAVPVTPVEETRAITADQLWASLTYFLERVLPVAEQAGVKLAMHPDDPPMRHLRGQDRIMHQPEDFHRLLDLVPSPSNAVCFCQGTFAELGLDVPALIRELGPHIAFAHFRDVHGTVPRFRETFCDTGDTDMVEAVRAYRDIGFTGPVRPDHVPTLSGEANDHPGYTMLGRLHAAGYMRGLIHAVDKLPRLETPDAAAPPARTTGK